MKLQTKNLFVRLAPLASACLLTGVAGATSFNQDAPTEGEVAAVANSAKSTWLDLREWLGSGEAYLKLRYRFESVDQMGFPDDAHASTLRTVLGYKLGDYGKFSGAIEFEDVQQIGNGTYNSTTNGSTTRPIVADPEGGEINQAYFVYSFDDKTQAKVGRQSIVIDNARFIGNVSWRQNEQTFDAASVTSDAVDGLSLHYTYLQNANRIFGEFHPAGDIGSESHLLHASHVIEDVGELSVYGYLLDLEVDSLSTSTFGVRFVGEHAVNDRSNLLYTLEVAQQEDAASNPNNVDAGYLLGELGIGLDAVTFTVGMEVLDGSAADGQFSTPLATLHKFNGWADQFLATPTTGLEDTYLMASGKVNDVTLKGIFHDFSSESGGGDYGTELDLLASYPVAKGLDLGLKYADFNAENGSGFVDTEKIWLWMTMSF